MKNRELFQRDPAVSKLLNDGVAAVREAASDKEIETLRYELEHFVCEGQYEDGLIRILDSYLGNVSSTTQPAAWVSGFFGSGKSHLLKMLRHLWVDTHFTDGATARGLTRLPQEVQDPLPRRFGYAAFGRRRECAPSRAEHRSCIQGPARGAAAGAVLHVAPEEQHLRPGESRGRSGLQGFLRRTA
jgi:hypothetical protein